MSEKKQVLWRPVFERRYSSFPLQSEIWMVFFWIVIKSFIFQDNSTFYCIFGSQNQCLKDNEYGATVWINGDLCFLLWGCLERAGLSVSNRYRLVVSRGSDGSLMRPQSILSKEEWTDDRNKQEWMNWWICQMKLQKLCC